MRRRRTQRGESTLEDTIVDDVIRCYLNSDDFNGFNWSYIPSLPEGTPELLKEIIRPLIAAGRLSIRFADQMPFIKRLPDAPIEYQLQQLDKSSMDLVRLFPTIEEMKKRVRSSRYPGRPFSLELARGHAQLEPRFFDPVVLEQYINDPRYTCPISDISGSIHPRDEGHERQSDRVYLQTFGFAYDSKWNRAVVVYLRYLHDFSPEHQQLWRARELQGDYELHPDYFRGSIIGVWSDHVQILDAILMEQKAINDMARLMSRPPLFHHEFVNSRPEGLRFLIRPSRREYLAFIHVLDKILSDNINLDFFGNDVQRTEPIRRADGETETRLKGSLRILEEWLRGRFHPREGDPIAALMAPLKKVRRLRQKPAHALQTDKFDKAVFKQQFEEIVAVYESIAALRTIFQQHPSCAAYQLDEFLRCDKIRTF